MASISHILALATVYAAALGLEQKTVSWRVFGDSKKLSALEAGSDIQLSRYEAAIRWFAAHWPASAGWPEDVPRPVEAA